MTSKQKRFALRFKDDDILREFKGLRPYPPVRDVLVELKGLDVETRAILGATDDSGNYYRYCFDIHDRQTSTVWRLINWVVDLPDGLGKEVVRIAPDTGDSTAEPISDPDAPFPDKRQRRY